MGILKNIWNTIFGKTKKQEVKSELGNTYTENELSSLSSKGDNEQPIITKKEDTEKKVKARSLNKEQKVIEYLKKYGSIDKMTCAEKFNLKRLDNLICELRKQGMNIQNETIELHNEKGEKIKVNNYKLVISDGTN